jgi:hypothetical protein
VTLRQSEEGAYPSSRSCPPPPDRPAFSCGSASKEEAPAYHEAPLRQNAGALTG